MTKKEKTGTRPTAKADTMRSQRPLLFSRVNYLIMIAGIVLIGIGFMLMYGTEDIFSPTKITVAPLLVLAGFVTEVFAIFYKPADKTGHGDA